jgi:Putative MetA-pathway of phenol degradation
MVKLLPAFSLVLLAGLPVAASDDAPIQDNSFLIEEAYNQETGVVQHINTFSRLRDSGEWAYTFTQEWPAPNLKHQLSFTLPVEGGTAEGGRGLGDMALNYRYQWIGDGDAPVAFAPRLSLLLPTGSVEDGRGTGALGLQLNLPLSTVLSPRWVAHWNAGTTFVPSAENADGQKADTWGYYLGQSFIWQPSSTWNFLLETLWESGEAVAGNEATETEEELLLSPGVRRAFNFSNGLQVVAGLAVPIGIGPSRGEESLFLYLSFEHPFRVAR